MSDDQLFNVIYAVSLVLALSALALPIAHSRQRWLRQAAVWVLIGGFALAVYKLAVWLLGP